MIDPEVVDDDKPILDELFSDGGIIEDGIAFDGVIDENNQSKPQE